mmetsp:Transcript_69352/g.162347  ORF Transcript_69352/g.162347 Transcript_69352/m.162347 type:complete len:250 (-) Transcript_69352:198-947(-)
MLSCLRSLQIVSSASRRSRYFWSSPDPFPSSRIPCLTAKILPVVLSRALNTHPCEPVPMVLPFTQAKPSAKPQEVSGDGGAEDFGDTCEMWLGVEASVGRLQFHVLCFRGLRECRDRPLSSPKKRTFFSRPVCDFVVSLCFAVRSPERRESRSSLRSEKPNGVPGPSLEVGALKPTFFWGVGVIVGVLSSPTSSAYPSRLEKRSVGRRRFSFRSSRCSEKGDLPPSKLGGPLARKRTPVELEDKVSGGG